MIGGSLTHRGDEVSTSVTCTDRPVKYLYWYFDLKKSFIFSVIAQFVIQLRALKRQQNCCSFMYIYIIGQLKTVLLWLFAIECNSISCLDKIHLKIYYFHNIISITIKCLYKIAFVHPFMSVAFWKTWWKLWSFFFLIECMHAGVHNLLIIQWG